MDRISKKASFFNHNLDDLIKRADKAVYLAKHRGRDQLALVTESESASADNHQVGCL